MYELGPVSTRCLAKRLSAGVLATALSCLGASSIGAEEADRYLWLEQVRSPQVNAWVRAENEKTARVLEKDQRFPGIYSNALKIAEAKDRTPTPVFLNGRIFNFWQDSDHIRGIWRYTSLSDFRNDRPSWHTALDLDSLAVAEKANWVYEGADCDEPGEQRCMIELSDGGEDAKTVREFDVVAARFIDKGFVLPHGKQIFAWQDHDNLLVSREWSPGEHTRSGYPYIVKRLRRDQSLADATELFRGSSMDGGYGVRPVALQDGAGHRALLIERPLSTFEAERYLVTGDGVKRLVMPLKAEIQALVGGKLVISMNEEWQLTSGRRILPGTLVAIDLVQATADPQHLKPVVMFTPGPHETFQTAAATRDALIVTILDDVKGRVLVYRLSKSGIWTHRLLNLPNIAAIDITDADLHGDNVFLTISGFLQPPTLILANARTGAVATVKTLPPQFDASNDVVEQFWASSTDGTKVPYFVVHPRGMKRDGSNPTIITAYGGFQVSETPFYSGTTGKLWLEKGGVYALANIRGGGEFGPAWHEAGLKTHRQHIYDDFTAVAQDLIARNITSPKHLGIEGGSNGGLLMGVEFTQHPDLWNAVDIRVPLLDMLRFEKIAAGSSWVGEYGSISIPAERAFLASISPYNNVRKGTRYPEPLIWTTTKDDRVGPQHARKFAAKLAQFGIPYLYYEVTEGGHGAGANLREKAHTSALEFTYFARKLMN